MILLFAYDLLCNAVTNSCKYSCLSLSLSFFDDSSIWLGFVRYSLFSTCTPSEVIAKLVLGGGALVNSIHVLIDLCVWIVCYWNRNQLLHVWTPHRMSVHFVGFLGIMAVRSRKRASYAAISQTAQEMYLLSLRKTAGNVVVPHK